MAILKSIWHWVWLHHYKISPLVWYGLLLVVGISIWITFAYDFGVGNPAWSHSRNVLWTFSIALSATALTRWRLDRWRTRRGLVIPLFFSRNNAVALELQNRIVTHLQDNLPHSASVRIHRLPIIVGGADKVLARSLHRRLNATYLLYGDISVTDSYTKAFPRIFQRIERPFYHFDFNTRDITPAFTRRAALFYRLSPAPQVTDYEYPPEFGDELEALLRLITADVAVIAQQSRTAFSLMSNALKVCIDKQTPQVDALVSELALIADREQGPDLALQIVYPRAQRAEPEPAPDLLRTAHQAAFRILEMTPLSTSDADDLAQLSISWLRRAAAQESDPKRDITLYNLAHALATHGDVSEEEEAIRLLHEVRNLSPFYRRAWYVHRELGAIYWQQFHESGEGVNCSVFAKRSARHYSKAISKRPRTRWFYRLRDGNLVLRHQFERLPIMYANAADAHLVAENGLRGKWYTMRSNQLRHRMLKIARAAGDHSNWQRAYAYFDWARTGWKDVYDVYAYVGCAFAGERSGRPQHLVEQAWQEAESRYPEMTPVVRETLEERWS